nr:MAG TPA: hypothetical protein [Caudoviricetes sp.]
MPFINPPPCKKNTKKSNLLSLFYEVSHPHEHILLHLKCSCKLFFTIC